MGEEASPLVSVCMPAYNVERVLAPALSSVLSQTYPNLEVVLVDDGSTDGTAAVARSFTDPRLRCVRNETNLGGYQTMNRAVSFARGDFVAVYHSDDVYRPTIVEKEVAYLQTHPDAGAVFCLDDYINAEGRPAGRTLLPRSFRWLDSFGYEDVFPLLLRHKNVLFRCPTFMARREVLAAIGPFDATRYDIAADLDMWIRIIRRYAVGIINERLMSYRRGTQQWSYRHKKLRTDEEPFFAIMDHYLDADSWREKLCPGDLREYEFHRCDDETSRAANYVILGDFDRARELLRRRPYPWTSLLKCFRRRKLRVLLLRVILNAGLALRITNVLTRLVTWTEYGERTLGTARGA